MTNPQDTPMSDPCESWMSRERFAQLEAELSKERQRADAAERERDELREAILPNWKQDCSGIQHNGFISLAVHYREHQ